MTKTLASQFNSIVFVAFFALLIVIGSFTPVNVQDAKSKDPSGPLAKPPTPTPIPTPTPGCATVVANTNPWMGSGGLDLSFGTGGITMTDASGPASGNDMVEKILVQADGKIVTVGNAYNPVGLTGTADLLVTRYNQNGMLDTGFGMPDLANPGQRLGYVFVDFSGGLDRGLSAALDAYGRILITGTPSTKIARLDTHGDLDPTFGTGGKIETGVTNLVPNDIEILSNGKILLAGGEPNFTMARFNENGSLDTTFGSGGSVSVSFGGKHTRAGTDSVSTQWILGEERIVLGGGSPLGATLMRFRSNGQVDTSFGVGGKASTIFGVGTGPTGFYDHVIDSNNRIVAVGSAGTPCGWDAGFARFTENGVLDTTFSGDGKFTLDIYGGTNYANSVVIQSDGKILSAGGPANPSLSVRDFGLVRLNINGTPDGSFGPGTPLGSGIVTTNIFGTTGSSRSVALQPGGYIVVGGTSGGLSVVTRYLP